MREQFHVDGPLRASVTLGVGRVCAEPTAGEQAWVVVEAVDPGHEPSVRLAARASVRLTGDRLRVDLPDSARSFRRAQVAVTLGLPAGSSLDVKGGAADTSVRGGVDTLVVRIGSGEVEVDEATTGVSVKAGTAQVRVGMAGSVTLAAGRGTLHADRVGGATVKVGQGSVSIGHGHGAMLVKGGRVQLTVGAAGQGEVVLDTGSGGAVIGVAAGTTVQLDLVSAAGDVRCELPMESAAPAGGAGLRVRLRTGSGDLRVTAAATADR